MWIPREPLLPEWKSLPPLGESSVQVFALRADSDPGLLARSKRVLSTAERERAERLRVPRAREDFQVGRAALRTLLGAVLGCDPAAVALQTDPFGKPLVPGVHANVSHSHGLIYVALCRAEPVGVDVERVDPELEVLELAEANFRAEEMTPLAAAAAGAERARAFCALWTRKEAVAKAHGHGLRIPLQDIHVPAQDEGVGWIENLAVSAGTAGNAREKFSVTGLLAPTGFMAALAVRGARVPVTFLPADSVPADDLAHIAFYPKKVRVK